MDEHTAALVAEANRRIERARRQCLARLAETRQALDFARGDYDLAIRDGHAVGLSNTEMARAAGISEAGIRLRLKRQRLSDDNRRPSEPPG